MNNGTIRGMREGLTTNAEHAEYLHDYIHLTFRTNIRHHNLNPTEVELLTTGYQDKRTNIRLKQLSLSLSSHASRNMESWLSNAPTDRYSEHGLYIIFID